MCIDKWLTLVIFKDFVSTVDITQYQIRSDDKVLYVRIWKEKVFVLNTVAV
jgi:hypothetical protein